MGFNLPSQTWVWIWAIGKVSVGVLHTPRVWDEGLVRVWLQAAPCLARVTTAKSWAPQNAPLPSQARAAPFPAAPLGARCPRSALAASPAGRDQPGRRGGRTPRAAHPNSVAQSCGGAERPVGAQPPAGSGSMDSCLLQSLVHLGNSSSCRTMQEPGGTGQGRRRLPCWDRGALATPCNEDRSQVSRARRWQKPNGRATHILLPAPPASPPLRPRSSPAQPDGHTGS